jgi:hypothetical protein
VDVGLGVSVAVAGGGVALEQAETTITIKKKRAVRSDVLTLGSMFPPMMYFSMSVHDRGFLKIR